jgi:spore cortex biosynthesis protein YabQ
VVNNQAYLFLIFTFDGIIIGVLFDFFRILRKIFKTKDFVTYIEDIFFWVITGIIILYSMYRFCDGEIRLFMIFGLIIGIGIYIFTINKYIMKIFLQKKSKKCKKIE